MTQPPCSWLVEHRHLLPDAGDALDVACGRGRNALWLASHGFVVRGVDRDPVAIEHLRQEASRRDVNIDARVMDLETGSPDIAVAAYDVVLGVHYLHRPLFPAMITALRPGGLLVYETFTRDQAARGRPTNPAFLLERGELRALVSGLTILDEREGDYEGRSVASVVARNDVR
jgi:tellurite methyltransferase